MGRFAAEVAFGMRRLTKARGMSRKWGLPGKTLEQEETHYVPRPERPI